ncbi:hypothetical protein D0T84_19410 [Dysgonomonas sp. 521]|uniref:hypothetical protein n=1 Tax=Dysgonomonas sp. 521 TaxID=2302932 RepID=UPI0013D7F272|nr:hypothetical protein [Dysgonomonas sp. 521]NDV97057.1 hypothetical protein [Dysgonomonas sp. 521]
MTHNINGVVITDDVIEAMKTIQECSSEIIKPIDMEMEYIILDDSSPNIHKRLSDLLLIKRLLTGIANK